MDPRLAERIQTLERYASVNGWEVATQPLHVEGCTEAVGVGGVFRFVDEPGIAGGEELMFTIAYGVNARTGRLNVLQQGQYADARFVVTLEGTTRYWRGPAGAWRAALEDPAGWCTGLELGQQTAGGA